MTRTPGCPHRRSPRCGWTPARPRCAARRWRAARSDADIFLRTYRDTADGVPDSYQVIVALEKYPDTGLRWPHATIFKVLDDLTTPATTLDWTIHFTFDTAETAVAIAHNVITNIKDQARQLGRHADSDDELIRKLVVGQAAGLRAQARQRRARCERRGAGDRGRR